MASIQKYEKLLSDAKLEVTTNRILVLEILGNTRDPLSAGELHATLKRSSSINRVTVYRILDLFVERGIVERISTGGRAFYYDLMPNDYRNPIPLFYCKCCGRMERLRLDGLTVDTDLLWRTYPGRIEKVEIRLDGICKNCEKGIRIEKTEDSTTIKANMSQPNKPK